jgi:hypothetical protein
MSALADNREPATTGTVAVFVMLALAVLSGCSAGESSTPGGDADSAGDWTLTVG